MTSTCVQILGCLSSLIHFKSRKVASQKPKFNPTDALLPSACVPIRRLFSPLLSDSLKKKKLSDPMDRTYIDLSWPAEVIGVEDKPIGLIVIEPLAVLAGS